MPPLVSEESADYTEDEERSIGETTGGETTPIKPATTNQIDPRLLPQIEILVQTNNPQSNGLTNEDSPQEMDDQELGYQLQKSAQVDDEDVDAEGEDDDAPHEPDTMDVDFEEQDTVVQTANGDNATGAGETAEEDEESSDAEGEDVDDGEEEEGEQDEEEDATNSEQEVEDNEVDSDVDEQDDEESESEADAVDQSSESEEEDDITNKQCIFCEKEEADEAKDSMYVCGICNKYAHPKCAEANNAVRPDRDDVPWRCPSCAELMADSESPRSALARVRNSNSAPRLVRDLLPVSRGVQKPNSHSIFAQPLISDDEEGGRALRKRKSPTHEPMPEKRRRKTPQIAASEEGVSQAVAHSTRGAIQTQKEVPIARVLQHRPPHKPPPHKFILAFRLGQDRIEKILSKPPRPGRRRDRRKPPKILPPPIVHVPVPKFPALPPGNLIFPSIFNDRENELNAKPYGGVLGEAEADTSRSLPQLKDRDIFEIARKEAEEERRRTSEAAETEINGEINAKPNRTVSGPPSKIKCIQFGKYVIDTFYAAPYPEEYSHESRLFICEFCLKYLPSEFVAYRHKLKCPAKHPPGDEIYRDGSISIWEVDGRKKTEYCQCLCLMAKMFLGSKTLYYDVEPFLFYILTEYDETGYHFVGYFSKEKRPASQNNVSCILVMPIHQRKGYATFLIDFSYLLTRIEGKEGSPEKPLSDMGLTAYRAYWDLTISQHLLDIGLKPFSTKMLMARTGMTADDVIHSLERLYAFTRDPVTKTYAIRYDKRLYDSIVADYTSKKHRNMRPENLIWTPYVMGRSDQANLDNQPMVTVAPREGDPEEESMDPDAISPRTKSREESIPRDPELVNESGNIAPGPPSTDVLNAAVPVGEVKVNGLVNGNVESTQDTGYALVFRTNNIPPSRFQIEPPIPPSMLRNRSVKKRNHGPAFGRSVNGGNKSPLPLATRSSPRNANSTNGSVAGGRHSRAVSEEKVMTPVRRSVRKSGLANVEVASSLDGVVEDEVEGDVKDEDEEGDEEEGDEEDGEDEEEGGEDEEEDGEEEEEDGEDEEEEDGEDDEADPDVELAEEEEGSEESEEAEPDDAVTDEDDLQEAEVEDEDEDDEDD